MIVVIINKKAFNFKAYEKYLDCFQKNNIKYKLYILEPNQLEQTIENLCETSNTIVVGGGDGTIRTAAERCYQYGKILGVIPLGTLNHFSKESSLPIEPDDLVKAIQNRSTIDIDIGVVNEKIFLNNASIGLYVSFTQLREYYRTYMHKFLAYIPAMISIVGRAHKHKLVIKSTKESKEVKTTLLMISNNLYTTEPTFEIKRSSFQENLLGIYFDDENKTFWQNLFRTAESIQKKLFAISPSDNIIIDLVDKDSTKIALDGDIMRLKSPLKFKSIAKALKVLR